MKALLAEWKKRAPFPEVMADWKKHWPPQATVAELKKRWQPQSALAVTIEAGRLLAEVVRRETGAAGKDHRIEIPLEVGELLADPEKVGAKLAAQLAAAGVRERRCAVCLPPNWALATSTDVPEMNAEDLRGYLELRAEREFPMPPAELRLAHCAFSLPGGIQRATLVAVPVKRMNAVERMLAAAGCKVASVSLGLNRCLNGPTLATVHLLANCDHVDVVITAGGGIAALRSIAAPAAQDEAFDPAAFCREVRITLGRLPEPLRREVNEAHFGGVRATAETLCRKTRDYFHRMGVEPAAIDREEEPPALEAASRLLREQPLPFEFVAPQENRWEKVLTRFQKKQHRQLLGAAGGLVLLLLLTYAIRSHLETSLETEWKGMSRNVADVEQIQQKIRQFRPWFSASPETLPLYEALADAFPDGGDVWAKNIQITDASKVACTGFARNQAAFQTLRDRLRSRPGVTELQVQQLRGENPVEFAFTYKAEPRP